MVFKFLALSSTKYLGKELLKLFCIKNICRFKIFNLVLTSKFYQLNILELRTKSFSSRYLLLSNHQNYCTSFYNTVIKTMQKL